MCRKYYYEDVKQYFSDNGCELLEEEYKSILIPLSYKCICGEISKIRFSEFKNGIRCRFCANNKKYDFNFVYNYFKDKNCELLEIEYINNKTKMKYKCKNNHISFSNFDNFKNKEHRCRKCFSERNSGENCNLWNPDREQVRLNKIVRKRCENFLSRILKCTNDKKLEKTQEILGYTPNQLLEHLQKDPNYKYWANDTKNYHIDHIIPIFEYVKTGITDPKIINSLDNLRILSAKENLIKGKSVG